MKIIINFIFFKNFQFYQFFHFFDDQMLHRNSSAESIDKLGTIFLPSSTKKQSHRASQIKICMFRSILKLARKTLSVPICRGPPILLGTLHPYYSRAGEVQFCSTSHLNVIARSHRSFKNPLTNSSSQKSIRNFRIF